MRIGISKGCAIQWLGFNKKVRTSGARVSGQGSNLISFTGDGLSVTVERVVMRKMREKPTAAKRWAHWDCMLIRDCIDVIHCPSRSLAVQRPHLSGVDDVWRPAPGKPFRKYERRKVTEKGGVQNSPQSAPQS